MIFSVPVWAALVEAPLFSSTGAKKYSRSTSSGQTEKGQG